MQQYWASFSWLFAERSWSSLSKLYGGIPKIICPISSLFLPLTMSKHIIWRYLKKLFNSGTQFNVLVKLFRLKTLKKCLPVEKLKNKKTKSCIKSSFLSQLYLYNTCMWRQFFASHTCNYIVILSFKEYFYKNPLSRQLAFELQSQCTRIKWMLFFCYSPYPS